MVFVLTACFLALVLPVHADDWQGKKLANFPTNFIVGYGSLINSPSRNGTAGKPVPAIPVRVLPGFGFARAWNTRNPSGHFTALGLRKTNPGEPPRTINAVLYAAEGDDMSAFDKREGSKYVRLEVPLAQIEAIGWQRLPESGRFWIYVPVVPSAGGTPKPGEGLPAADFDYPLLQSYIDVVIEGSLEHGPDFARELLATTDGWSRFWLNDRELARRPWVHDPMTARVDELLAATPETAALFADCQFPETYAEKLRGH